MRSDLPVSSTRADPAWLADDRPDWARLPADVLQHTLLLAAACVRGRLNAHTQWCRLAAAFSSTCRSMRAALQGPDSGLLWEVAVLSSAHPGLTSHQSQGLNRMLAARAHFATSLVLYGGGWDATELDALIAAHTGLCQDLVLKDVHDPLDAAIVGHRLSARPFHSVFFEGTAGCSLPSTARMAKIDVTLPGLEQVGGVPDLQRFLGCLQPLSGLQKLDLRMMPWCLTSQAVDDLVCWHPQLRHLRLQLLVDPLLGSYAIDSLQRLPSVQLVLTLIVRQPNSPLSEVLRQLQALQQLHALTIVALVPMTVTEAAHLAGCNVQQLTLCFSDPALRLRQLPPSARVTYKPHKYLRYS